MNNADRFAALDFDTLWSLPSAGGHRLGAYFTETHPDDAETYVDDDEHIRSFSSELHTLPEHRQRLLFRVRRQLAEGAYESPEKLEAALSRMCGGLFDDLDDDVL